MQQFRMVRQKLLNRMLDECLYRHAAQHGGELELPVFRFGNAGSEPQVELVMLSSPHSRMSPSRTRFAALSPASGPSVGLEAIRFAVSPLPRSQPRKAGVEFGMRTVVVGHSRSRQAALRGDKAVDPPPRPLMPADIEGGQFGEELQLAVRQMVRDPPCKCARQSAPLQ